MEGAVTTYGRKYSDNSFEGKTVVPLGSDRRSLSLHTYKGGRGLIASASVFQESEDGRSITHAIGFGICGDFSKTLARRDGVRCTEKNVRALHEELLAIAPDILKEAQAWYAEGRNIRK
jgi:hypothetical protein